MESKSRIIQGLMRIEKISDDELYSLIKFDLENGINLFDLSDIYGLGECERKVGRVLKAHPELREQMIIQTKCGIVKEEDGGQYYDLSFEHITSSVDKSLERLGIEYVDILLLHRPDIFLDSGEIARALASLLKDGKVRHFGVSNFPHETMKYVSDQTNIPININQLQLGLGHLDMVNEVLNVNFKSQYSPHSTELYFYMRRHGFKIQAWSPFQTGDFKGCIFDEDKYPELNWVMGEIAAKYGVSKCAVATAFVLKLGKNIDLVTGSTKIEHVKEALDGTKIELTKAEWYRLFRTAGNLLP